MAGVSRYLRLLGAFARFALLNEMAFRGNFVLKVLVEVLWLGVLLVFNLMLYSKTPAIAGWDQAQFLFFLGCYYTLEGLIETFFLENCTGFAELVRGGGLDQYLLQPIDEQFLITFRHVDWSTAPKLLLGAGIMAGALAAMGEPVTAAQVAAFVLLMTCSVALTYSFLLVLTSTAVWLVRNQSLMEMWWLFTMLMRYPREIYRGSLGYPINVVFSFVIPAMLVIHVPATVMARHVFELETILTLVAAAAVMLGVSRWVFRRALASYRSASS